MCLQVRISPAELVQWRELQVISCIDEASFGEVLLAKRGSDVVCIKRCRNGSDGSMTKEQLQNFEREINAYRTLRHPGITSYLGCILEQPNLAVVIEHLPNGNVFDLLYMNRVNVTATIRLKIASQVTDAVSFMHSSDPLIAHLDLKTPNILLDRDFNAKLCDFGKSRVIDPRGSVVEGQELLGSPRYMAPELFGGPGTAFSEKADIWGLSCCLVEIMGGPIPYEDVPDVEDIMAAHTRRIQPMVPSWFAFVARLALERCFDFDPDRRLKAAELLRTLQLLTPHEMELHGMDKRRAR